MGPPKIGQTGVVEVPSTTANIGPGFDCLGAALDLSNQFTIKRIEGNAERFELMMEPHCLDALLYLLPAPIIFL